MGRVGVFGGTFDPIHLGHLRAAEEFGAALSLSRVLLVPCARPPHRPGPPAASPADRLEMVRRAAEGNPLLVPCDLEVVRQGPSYTSLTLETLAVAMPGEELVLAMGADAWREFPTWNRPQVVLELAKVAVLARPGIAPFPLPEGLPPGLRALFAARVESLPVTPLDISASRVRALAAAGGSIRYLVPEPVRDFIRERGLYRAPGNNENGRDG